MLTTPHRDAAAFDSRQPFPVVRSRRPVLLPVPETIRWIREAAEGAGASLAVLDPALPLGLVGPRLGMPYAVVVHGAELTVPARLPVAKSLLEPVLRGAAAIVAAGGYAAAEAARVAGAGVPIVDVPPGVDVDAFHPLAAEDRAAARAGFGLPGDARVVVSLSRLVPRKGMDVLVAAASLLARDRPDLVVAIAGTGRDRPRLERLVEHCGAPVRFLGWVTDVDRARLLACADVFAMLCRNRWAGLEQEGFGIVFLEAAACGVAQVAGASGGAADAVAHGETGAVVSRPDDPVAAAAVLGRLLDDEPLRRRLGDESRRRVERAYAYDILAARLAAALTAAEAATEASAGPAATGGAAETGAASTATGAATDESIATAPRAATETSTGPPGTNASTAAATATDELTATAPGAATETSPGPPGTSASTSTAAATDESKATAPGAATEASAGPPATSASTPTGAATDESKATATAPRAATEASAGPPATSASTSTATAMETPGGAEPRGTKASTAAAAPTEASAGSLATNAATSAAPATKPSAGPPAPGGAAAVGP